MKKSAALLTRQFPGVHNDLSGLWLAPFVIAARIPVLMAESLNPNPSKRTETNRMVQEKLSAVQEGMVAAQVALGQACMENWAAFAFGQVPKSTPRKTANAMVQAGFAPAARKVKANIRRLASN